MNAQDRSSIMGLLQNCHRHDALQRTRPTARHAASRGSTYHRSSSHRQQHAARSLQPPERLLPRDPQLPYPHPSPRLRGGDNTLEATGSAYVLPVPDSSCPHITPVEQHQRGQRSISDTGQLHAQQGYSQGLPFVYQQHFHPWSGHAQSTQGQSNAIPDEVQHPQQQQRSSNPCGQAPRPAFCSSPEAPPPLPPGPPPAAAVSAPIHRLQAAAASGNRDDSSDSSSSQLASSQRHSTRVLPGIPGSGRTGSPVPAARVDASTAPNDLQQDSGRAPGLLHTMTKQQAADAVKALIKPLYVAKALSKDQFKTVAQTCTHALADADRHLGENDGVHEIVRNCLTGMGLSDAVAQL